MRSPLIGKPRGTCLPIKQRLAVHSMRDPETGCLVWVGGRFTNGYGQFSIVRDGRKRKTTAHRASYEAHIGPVPEGKHLDHLCRNRACIEPSHLEPVSPSENILRGESYASRLRRTGLCKNGHQRAPGTVGICRDCARETMRRVDANRPSSSERAKMRRARQAQGV